MTILILSIFQVFLLDLSLFKDLHIAFAQSTNATSIFVPSNMNKMEIILKNDQLANTTSLLDNPVLVAGISGGTALLGGIIGSLMTYRIEYRKEKIEKVKQNHFEENVRAMIIQNLRYVSDVLKDLRNLDMYVNKSSVRNARLSLESIHKLYSEMSFEVKCTCFKPDVLTYLQYFYDNLALFSAGLRSAFDRYDESVNNNEHVALERLKKDLSDMHLEQLSIIGKKTFDLLNKNI